MFKIIRLILALLERIHRPLAFKITTFLIRLPQSLPANDRDKAFMKEAQRIEFEQPAVKGKNKRVALSWGSGPLIIMLHGWEGRSTQLTIIAKRLASLGFQAVALDARAHGESEGRMASFKDYIDDLDALIKHLNTDVHAMLGHSAGGLCMMAARDILGVHAKQYITISSPPAPYPLIDAVRRHLNVSEIMVDMIKAKVAKDFACDWETLTQGEAFKQLHNDEELLLIYDKQDDVVDHHQSDVIQSIWPDAKLYKSEGLGHFKLLWAEDVVNQVTEFITPSST